jgi:O-antigen/teichoic acid export membrane protein
MNLRRSFSLSLGTSVAIQALNVVTGILLARALGPEGRGELAVIVLWPAVLSAVGSLGISEAATYHAARGASAIGRLIGSSIVVAAAQSGVLVAVGILLFPAVLSNQDDFVRHVAVVYLAYIPLSLLTLHLMGVLNGLHRFRAYNGLRLTYFVAVAGGLVAVSLLDQLTAVTAVAVYLSANAVTAVATIALVLKGSRGRIAFSRSVASTLVRYGLKSHTSGLSSMLNERLDQLLISVFLAPAKLGLYVVAVTLTSLTHLIGTSAGAVGLPIIARLRSQEERLNAASRLIRLTLLGSIAVTVPLLLLTPTLIEMVFGPAFVGAAGAARILLVATVLLSLTRVLEATLKAVNRPLDAGAAHLAALVVTAVGLAALLPAFGIVGAAIASLLAYAVGAAWGLHRAASALGVGPMTLLWQAREFRPYVARIASGRSGGEL